MPITILQARIRCFDPQALTSLTYIGQADWTAYNVSIHRLLRA